MATIKSIRSLNACQSVMLAFTPQTFALPQPIHAISQSIHSLLTAPTTSIRSSTRSSILSKRYSDNNVGAAVGPLIGAVVLLFAVYITYQWWRKKRDKAYFYRKEGGPPGRGTPATTSTVRVQGASVERQPSDKSDSSTDSRASGKSASKTVSSGGILEVMIKEEEEGIRSIQPIYSERRDSRNRGKEAVSSPTGSRTQSRETSQDRSSVVSNATGDRRERNSVHSTNGEKRESIGGIRLSQGAQRQVEIKVPEPVRHKAAGVRGSDYWTKNTSASQLAPE